MRLHWIHTILFGVFSLSWADIREQALCWRQFDGLYPTGPCEQKILYCKNGKSSYLLCPSHMVFNSNTKFCERPVDFLTSSPTPSFRPHGKLAEIVPVWSNTPDQFLGEKRPSSIDVAEGHREDSVEVHHQFLPRQKGVLSSPSFNPDATLSYDVPVWSNTPDQFLAEEHPSSIDADERQREDSVEVHHQFLPRQEGMLSSPSFNQDETLSYDVPVWSNTPDEFFGEKNPTSIGEGEGQREDSVEVLDQFLPGQEGGKAELHKPLVDHFSRTKPFTNKKHHFQHDSTRYELLNDPFLGGRQTGIRKSPTIKPIYDNFYGKHTHLAETSEFASINSPVSAGHDSFRVSPARRTEASVFAPVRSPIASGHDIFNVRHRRHLNSTIQVNRCEAHIAQMHGKYSYPKKECSKEVFPLGCRSFYVACINGHQVQRFCPLGLFFNAVKEVCDQREHIEHCAKVRALQGKFVPIRVKPLRQAVHLRRNQLSTLPQQHQKTLLLYSSNHTTEGEKQPQQTDAYHNNKSLTNNESLSDSKNSSSTNYPFRDEYKHILPKHSVGKSRQTLLSLAKLPFYANFYPEQFCLELPDGFYRHPKYCSRVIQCFDKELFEYASCKHGLVFNEQIGICDYQTNVEECSQQTFPVESNHTVATLPPLLSMHDGCKGHQHGDHIADSTDCTQFHRCVWDRLVQMNCPRGTVFNPSLSVCDHANQVPHCWN